MFNVSPSFRLPTLHFLIDCCSITNTRNTSSRPKFPTAPPLLYTAAVLWSISALAHIFPILAKSKPSWSLRYCPFSFQRLDLCSTVFRTRLHISLATPTMTPCNVYTESHSQIRSNWPTIRSSSLRPPNATIAKLQRTRSCSSSTTLVPEAASSCLMERGYTTLLLNC